MFHVSGVLFIVRASLILTLCALCRLHHCVRTGYFGVLLNCGLVSLCGDDVEAGDWYVVSYLTSGV